MASQDNVRQQTATKQQASSVVFSDTNLTKLDERRIKRIGLYTQSDLAEINQLLLDLRRIFTKKDGLIDRQKIYIRLNGETRTTELTTDLNFPEAVDSSQRRSLLFLSDFARITIGLAKTFYSFWQDENLREYTQSLDELKKLSDLANSDDPEYVSELDLIYNAYKIEELLDLVTSIFEKHTGLDIQVAQKSLEKTATPKGTSTVPAVGQNSSFSSENETDPARGDGNQDDTFDYRSEVSKEALFVSSTAYFNLITQFLEEAGFAESILPLELQRQLAQLSDILEDKLWDIIEKLSIEQRTKLLSHSLRLYLYQRLLIELQQDPLFYTLLDQFYQTYAQIIYKENGLGVAEERIAKIEQYFATLNADVEIDSAELNPVLEKIRAQIRAWKAQVAEQAAAERKQEQQEEPESTLDADKNKDGVINPDELDDYAITKLAPPRVHFSPQQESQIDSYLSATGYDPQRRHLIQDQSARMLWGTLAELFKDDVDQLSRLPQNIRDQVYAETISYIMTLSVDELETLRTSPSTMNRFVRNNVFRIMGDAQFQHSYSQYTETKTATIISRANRVEKETEWAYQQLTFELFGAHNITNENVPDTPGLQDVKDEVEGYLKELTFAYMDQVSTEDLLHLYLHSKDRNEFLKEVHKYLNSDQVFVENISLFYNNLLLHYEKSEQFVAREELQRSLNTMAQYDGRFFRVRAAAPNSQVLLDNSLGKILKTDSKIIFDQSDLAVRTLVLNLGLQDTLNLIQKNRTSVLESIFSLPPGTLNDTNIEEYRTLLSEYAKVRASELVATTAAPAKSLSGIEAMYPGLQLDTVSDSPPTQPASISAKTASQLGPTKDIQKVVETYGKKGDQVVAEATDPKTLKEKRDIVNKIFGSEWGKLSQANQAGIYRYLKLQINKNHEQSMKADINYRLPFPLEFIDFRANKDYDKILGQITTEILNNGIDGYNQYLTAEYLDSENNAAGHQRKVNELILELKAYEFAVANEEEQQALAEMAGYANAEAFLAEQDLIFQQVLNNSSDVEAAAEQAEFLDAMLQADLAAQTNLDNQAYLENIETNQEVSGAEPTTAPQSGVASRLFSRKNIAGAFRKMAGKKVTDQVSKVAASTTIKGIAGAASGGTATVLMIGADLLRSKKFRELVIYGTTALVSSLLLALSSWGGILGAILGGAFGLEVGGVLGAAGGTLAGTYGGSAIFPQQWGSSIGFTPRQAPGLNTLLPENNASISDIGMRDARGAGNTGATTAASAAQGSSATSTASASNAASTAASQAASAAASTAATSTAGATTAAAASSFFSSLLGMPIALAAPTVALISVTFLSGATILVIMGAFLVPIPTRDSNWKGDNEEGINDEGTAVEVENQYIDVEKTASITQIQNNTATEVTYTIKVTPKNDYEIKITEVSDTFRKSSEGGPELISGITEGSFPFDPISEPIEFTYPVMIGEGLTDTRVTNTLNVGFEAIDRNGFVAEKNGLFKTSASVKVGTPKEGCWPNAGSITSKPYFGIPTHKNSDAYDIAAPRNTPIYAPYSGNLCKQPNDDGWNDGYGNTITLTVEMNGVTLVFRFAHLTSHVIPPGQQCMDVAASDLIARVGNTGNTSKDSQGRGGYHLHYELHHKTDTGGLKLVDLVPKEDGIPTIGDTVLSCGG